MNFAKPKRSTYDQIKLEICVVKLQNFERFCIITVETIKITVFYDVMPCSLVFIYRSRPKGNNIYEFLKTT